MLTAKRKLLLLSAFTILIALASAGCHGFFVDPTLTTITVTPATPNLTLNQSLQMNATGTYDDGSTKNLTGSATWTSSSSSLVSVSKSGLVTGVANTTSGVTITATSGTISGSTTVTVGATQTVTVTCTSCTNNTISIAAQGSNPVQFTSSVAANWSSSNSAILNIGSTNTTNGSGTLGGGSNTGTVTITATAVSGGGSGQVTITVNP